MENAKQQPRDWMDFGIWVGRQQAFCLTANQCSAAQAQCLKHMKETGRHEQLGLSWDEFCDRHLGVSRRTAERIIGQYDEFGESYFRLSSLVSISPGNYRALAPSVDGNCLDIDGEKVAIVPENAARIREFVRAYKLASRRSTQPGVPTIAQIGLRLRHLVLDARYFAETRLSPNDREQLQRHVGLAVQEWVRIGHILDEE